MLKYIVTGIIGLMLTLSAYTQHTVKGLVFDQNSSEALSGASIYLHELEIGTVSDESGSFSIPNLPDARLTFQISFLGYETRIIKTESEAYLSVGLQPTLVETPEVVVSASNFSSQHENAVKIESLHGKAIAQSGNPSFAASLAAIPGVDAISNGNGIGKPVIRGLSNSNVLMLNNGFRMDNYQFSELHPYVVDETGIDRIEVIKGPASLLYGADAIGGLINLLPEQPAAVGTLKGDVALRAYSASQGYSFNAGLKGTKEKTAWGLRGALKNHRDYIDGNDQFVPNSRFSQQSVKAFLNHNNQLGFFKLGYEVNHLEPGISNAISVNEVKENSYEKSIWFQDLTHHTLSSRNTFFIQNLKINANAAWQLNQRRLNTDEEGEVNMQLSALSYEVKTWLLSGKNNDLIVGFQGARRNNQNNEAHVRVLPDYLENEISLVGLYQHRLFDRLSLQTGLRFDHRSLDVPEQEKASHSHEAEEEEEESHEEELMPALQKQYNNLSFSAGATLDLSHELLFRMNVASAFRPPNVAELSQDGVHGSRYETGKHDLESQRNYEADFSMHYHTGNFSSDAAVFYNLIRRYIYLAPTDLLYNELPVYEYGQTNTSLYGGEFTLRYHPLSWFEVNSQYELVRGIRQSSDADGKNLPFMPHDKLKAALLFEAASGKMIRQPYASVKAVYAFAQNRPSAFETASEAYLLFDLEAGFSSGKNNRELQFTFNVNNLFNTVYTDHLSLLKPLGLYNPGRNIAIGIRYQF
ncbi:TonB-dependent receptor [Roseimarinus sediminis]|uniref:TonB-dependent receptor n=1 Tax=Roseimarinus sediminis TaxID=1610899 RepID=UPI003D1CD79C